MRFLNDGAYVQMAITGQGYCASVSRAFELIMNNAIRVGITDGISIFFTIIGILAVTASVAVGSYFAVTYIPYYQSRISSPFPVVPVLVAGLSVVEFVLYGQPPSRQQLPPLVSPSAPEPVEPGVSFP